MIANLLADLQFALRMTRKSIAFTLAAVLSLALGIGASSAIFSVVHAVLLDPYPYRDSNRIINIGFSERAGSAPLWATRFPIFWRCRRMRKRWRM
ncbi:MAG: hypothetical protein ABSH09_13985 [Bryobacteraceae bacterium]|jgi:hypothetical protein